MKKILPIIIAAVIAGSSAIQAADYPWLTFHLTDDTEVKVASDNLNISYEAGMLVMSSATVNNSIPVANIRSMQFVSDPSGISETETTDLTGGRFYTVGGTFAGQFESIDHAREALPSGIYVVCTDKKTIKVIF